LQFIKGKILKRKLDGGFSDPKGLENTWNDKARSLVEITFTLKEDNNKDNERKSQPVYRARQAIFFQESETFNVGSGDAKTAVFSPRRILFVNCTALASVSRSIHVANHDVPDDDLVDVLCSTKEHMFEPFCREKEGIDMVFKYFAPLSCAKDPRKNSQVCKEQAGEARLGSDERGIVPADAGQSFSMEDFADIAAGLSGSAVKASAERAIGK
jgi:hypothetical protein